MSTDAQLFVEALDLTTQEAARRYGATRAAFDLVSSSEPAAADSGLMALLGEAAQELNLPTMRLASGAGHDALFVSHLAPMAMVFIPCREGKSHCPEEWAEKEHLRDGADTILRAVIKLDRAP